MLRLRRAVFTIAVALLAANGCTNSRAPDSGGDAQAALRKAAAASVATASFHAEVISKAAAGPPDRPTIQTITGSVDFMAPDRTMTTMGRGAGAQRTIQIGDTAYYTDPGRVDAFRDGYYQEVDSTSSISMFVWLISLVQDQSQNVHFDGHTYRFDLPQETGRGTATVAGGRLAALDLTLEMGNGAPPTSIEMTFANYGSDISIDAPPSDHVISGGPTVSRAGMTLVVPDPTPSG
ncbi:MAG: hypothetical protein ACXVEI_08055 [Actinomycetota bacterium]